MPEPSSPPRGFQARPRVKHVNTGLLLLAALGFVSAGAAQPRARPGTASCPLHRGEGAAAPTAGTAQHSASPRGFLDTAQQPRGGRKPRGGWQQICHGVAPRGAGTGDLGLPHPRAEGWGHIPASHCSRGLSTLKRHWGAASIPRPQRLCRFLVLPTVPLSSPCRGSEAVPLWGLGGELLTGSSTFPAAPVQGANRNVSWVMLVGESVPGKMGTETRHCTREHPSPPGTVLSPHGSLQPDPALQLPTSPHFQVSITNPTMRQTSGSSRRLWRPSLCPSAARKGLLASCPLEKVPEGPHHPNSLDTCPHAACPLAHTQPMVAAGSGGVLGTGDPLCRGQVQVGQVLLVTARAPSLSPAVFLLSQGVRVPHGGGGQQHHPLHPA